MKEVQGSKSISKRVAKFYSPYCYLDIHLASLHSPYVYNIQQTSYLTLRVKIIIYKGSLSSCTNNPRKNWGVTIGSLARATVVGSKIRRRGLPAVGEKRRRSTREPRGCQFLPRFGPRGSGEGRSAVASGGNGERRRWDSGGGRVALEVACGVLQRGVGPI